MKKLAAALLLTATLALTACGKDPHAGEHCVKSHVEDTVIPVVMACGNGCITTVVVPSTETVCDAWAPDNPATVKPSKSS